MCYYGHVFNSTTITLFTDIISDNFSSNISSIKAAEETDKFAATPMAMMNVVVPLKIVKHEPVPRCTKYILSLKLASQLLAHF